MYDAVIIGAGVTGAAAARELSRFKAKICVLERAEDVCSGTSKANSAIIHAGFDPVPGTLMAKLNKEGSEQMEQLCSDLDVAYKKNGALVVCTDASKMDTLKALLQRGIDNGIKDLEIVEGDRLRELEPNLSDGVVAALYAPTSAIVDPFELTIALAENAYVNGAKFHFNSEVTGIKRDDKGLYHVFVREHVTSNVTLGTGTAEKPGEPLCSKESSEDKEVSGTRGAAEGTVEYVTRAVINAAGVYADAIHNMVSADKIKIRPRRGEYCLYDKELGDYVKHTIFQLPTEKGKGVLVTPTVHGNLLAGPTSDFIDDKDDTATTAAGLAEVLEKETISVKPVNGRKIITSFAGLRAHGGTGDFIIGEAKDAPLFYDLAGIESPGLSSCPAIGKMCAAWAEKALGLAKKSLFIGKRKGTPHFAEMSFGERQDLIRKDPRYGQIVCRCETVTEGEIVDAITRPLGARSLDGVKRRTRAGMGRCQAGFCSPKVLEIIHRETGLPYDQITKCGGKSVIVLEHTKGQTVEEAEGAAAKSADADSSCTSEKKGEVKA